MKIMKFTKQLFSLIFVASLLFACSKEDGQDGAIGPVGAQGEQGVVGTDGADGTQGEQGETGTANVIFSDWVAENFFNPNPSEINAMQLNEFSSGEFNIATDVILVYGGNNIFSNYEVFQLPYIRNLNVQYGFELLGNADENITTLNITGSTLDGSSANYSYFDFFRYIIIPGGNSTSGKSTIDYTKMTYEEVAAHFEIED